MLKPIYTCLVHSLFNSTQSLQNHYTARKKPSIVTISCIYDWQRIKGSISIISQMADISIGCEMPSRLVRMSDLVLIIEIFSKDCVGNKEPVIVADITGTEIKFSNIFISPFFV